MSPLNLSIPYVFTPPKVQQLSTPYDPFLAFAGKPGMVFKYHSPPRPKKSIVPPVVTPVSMGNGPLMVGINPNAQLVTYKRYRSNGLPKPQRSVHCSWWYFRPMSVETYKLMSPSKNTFFIEDGSKLPQIMRETYPAPEGFTRIGYRQPPPHMLQIDATAGITVYDHPILIQATAADLLAVARAYGVAYVAEPEPLKRCALRAVLKQARWEPIVYADDYILSYAKSIGYYSVVYSPKRVANMLALRRKWAYVALEAKVIPVKCLRSMLATLLTFIDMRCRELRSFYNRDKKRALRKGRYHTAWTLQAALSFINDVPKLRRQLVKYHTFRLVAGEALPYLAVASGSSGEVNQRGVAKAVLRILKQAGDLPPWLAKMV